MKPEEILSKWYEPKMHWNYVNKNNCIKAMEEYAFVVSQEKDRVHTESISTLLDLHKKELAKNYDRIAELENGLAEAKEEGKRFAEWSDRMGWNYDKELDMWYRVTRSGEGGNSFATTAQLFTQFKEITHV